MSIFRNPFPDDLNVTNSTVQSARPFFAPAIDSKNFRIVHDSRWQEQRAWTWETNTIKSIKMHNTHRIIWLWPRCRRYYFLICICNRWNRISVSVLWWVSFVWHTLNFLFLAYYIVRSVLSFRLFVCACSWFLWSYHMAVGHSYGSAGLYVAEFHGRVRTAFILLLVVR